MDLDFGVTGAGPAERKERTGAGMLRAEKKKVELPLGLSRRVCFIPAAAAATGASAEFPMSTSHSAPS